MDLIEELQEIDTDTLTSALFMITTVIGSLAAATASIRKRLMTGAVHLIGHTEEKFADQGKSGADKRAYAVSMLRQIVPKALRPFFPTRLLEQTVDNTFEAVDGYAKVHNGREKPDASCEEGRIPPFEEDNALPLDAPEPLLPARPDECVAVEAPEDAETRTVRVFSVQGRNGLLFRVRYGISRRQPRQTVTAQISEKAPGFVERFEAKPK